MPETVDMTEEITAIAKKKVELNDLLRKKALKIEESDYHEQLEKDTRNTDRKIDEEKAYIEAIGSPDKTEAIKKYAAAKRDLSRTENDLDYANDKIDSVHKLRKRTQQQNLELAVKEKELDNIKEKQKQYDQLTSETVENQADATSHKTLIDLKEKTHKAENEARAVQIHLNHLETEKYLSTQQQIADSAAKLEEEKTKADEMQNLLNTRRATRKVQAQRIARSKALLATPGQVSDDSIETLSAVQQQVLEAEKAVDAEEREREDFITGFLREAKKNPNLLDTLNQWGLKNRPEYTPFDTLDDFKNAYSSLLGDDGYQFMKEFQTYWNTDKKEEEEEA